MAFLYGLLDPAQDSRLFERIKSTAEHACLFEGTLDADLERGAPYIVRLRDDSALLQSWRQEGRGKNWGIVCLADEPLAAVRRHFRYFLQAKLPDGRVAVFRFWDPRVWRVYLPLCGTADLVRWFARVDEYHCEGRHGETLRYRMFNGELEVSEIGAAP
jgi:hypothetical protein